MKTATGLVGYVRGRGTWWEASRSESHFVADPLLPTRIVALCRPHKDKTKNKDAPYILLGTLQEPREWLG